jgi:hypothetical protein
LVFQKKKTFCLKNALLKKERGLIRFPLIKDKFQFLKLRNVNLLKERD